MSKKKVLFVHPNLSMGGAERMLLYYAKVLSTDYDVTILLLEKKEIFFDIPENINVVEYECGINETLKSVNIFRTFAHVRSIIACMKAIYRDYLPDAVIGFDDRATWLIWLAFRNYSTKLIYSQRNDPYDKSKIKNILFKHIYRCADGVSFQLKEVRDFYDLVGNKYVIIPNPVTQKIHCLSEKNNKTIISAGRFQDRKRFDLLIDAFSKVHVIYHEYELIIYGDGEERKQLEEQVKELKLEKSVCFPGFSKDIMINNRDAFCFVLSSDAEGMPNTLIEAMASGIPCVATDCTPGGARFLMDSGNNGFLVPRGDSDKLARAIMKYIKNPELRVEKTANATLFLEQMRPEIIDELWMQFITAII